MRPPIWLLLLAACAAPVEEAAVREGLNDTFLASDLDVAEFTERFEGESREVFRERAALLQALRLEPGMTVADVGAGTGAFTVPMAQAVGAAGRVLAVEISEGFIAHLGQLADRTGLSWVEPVLCTEKDPGLAPGSVDRIFCCDTYHHFTYPLTTTGHLLEALRPGGQLLIVDFIRIEGSSRPWILGHVRASKEAVIAEIESVGFELIDEVSIPGLAENYVLRFQARPSH